MQHVAFHLQKKNTMLGNFYSCKVSDPLYAKKRIKFRYKGV